MINATIIETQGLFKRGASGGPVVQDRGDLAGVVSSYNEQDRLVTWNIDVREVRTFLADAVRAAEAHASNR